MGSDLHQTVLQAFQDLLTGGRLAVVWSGRDPAAFDNAAVVLVGANVLIRIVRDRGDISVDVASVLFPNDWTTLQRALRAIGMADPPGEGLLKPEEAARILGSQLAALEEGLSQGRIAQARANLAELDAAALKRLVDRPASRGPLPAE